jgi:hypothetical protein
MPNKASKKVRAYRKAYRQRPEVKVRKKRAYGKPKYGRLQELVTLSG